MARTRIAALISLVALVTVVVAAAAFVGVWAGRETPGPRAASPPPVPSLVAGATVAPSPAASTNAPLPTTVAASLAALARAPGLGGRLRASIVDVASGATLWDRGGAAPSAPASTAKLLTAAAILTVRRPTDRFTTTLRRAADGSLVLVGGGDPTLTSGASPRYPDAASLRALAAAVRFRPTRILVDDSLFTGPTLSPAWAAEDIPSDYAAPITAVLTDGGRAAPGDTIRSTAPDLAAGRALATLLGRPSLPVARGSASGTVLASVRSAPVATLVAQMLLESDNVIAEVLARQVAVATGRPASFTGATAAIRTVLTKAGVDPGAGLLDGSGLAAADRVAPAVLARLLRVLATAGPRAVLTGLPVAAWSGTLADRYVGSAAGGDIRAKTGTLTGVSALAGLVHDRDGRLLAFSFVADRTTSTPAAEAALDALTARLAACGCR